MAEHSQVVAFDIYGTLLDTSSISRSLEEHLQLDKKSAVEVSALWRRYQLEWVTIYYHLLTLTMLCITNRYTWRLNSMSQ